ncbi:11478_t:CDS:2 [Entrophospora sp. SA101]|nr:11478_t:CDS:2 [Entrophospora sp. SA101]
MNPTAVITTINNTSNNATAKPENATNHCTIITGNSRQGGKSRDPVWNYFNATEIPHDSCLSAQSKFCFKPWKCGKPSDLKGHLALKCSLVNREVKLKYLRLIKSDDNIESANKK